MKANLSVDTAKRVDLNRLSVGLEGAKYLADNFVKTGRYKSQESWGPEGVLYLAESSWALMDAYRISGQEIYIDAVKSILKAIKKMQKPSGGWAIELGKSGIAFKVTDEEREDSALYEDPPTTAAFLRTIAEYQELTDDKTYFEMGSKAFEYLFAMWNEESRTFVDQRKRKLLGLRSNPNGYHLFFLIGIDAWRIFSPERVDRVFPTMLAFIKENFDGFDIDIMPLICALHAVALLDYCSTDYIETVIKDKILNVLVNNPTFKIPQVPGGYGHRDGSRGIVTTESNMRSCAGIALAMRRYDIVTNTQTFTSMPQYQSIANWIDQMKSNTFFYEFETLPERKKQGHGSPGQYLPSWWIFGKM
ncbi:MAG: hypothetical protein H7069_12400 [Phormidesmis sp. FL-bin-119]|nr:hypothetical protein [Pedobacter sp.]